MNVYGMIEIGSERLDAGLGRYGILDGKLLWVGPGDEFIEAWESYNEVYPWYYEFAGESWTNCRLGI